MTSYIKNRQSLLATGEKGLRRTALDIAEASIARVDPGRIVRDNVRLEGDELHIFDRSYDLSAGRRIFVVGAGKASYPIARALDDILGRRIHKGLVICKAGQEGSLDNIQLSFASHPVPDEASMDGCRRTVELLAAVRAGDIVLSCFTGGSSALFVTPAEGISLQDKMATNRILLGCGANIVEINAVRKHISKVKGGRLVRGLPAGTVLVNLTVSDVIGDHLDCIADPVTSDTSTFADAATTLDKYALWDKLPVSVITHLRKAAPEDATATDAALAHLDRRDILLITMDAACEAAADEARKRGFEPLILSTFFEGESNQLARNLVAIARQVLRSGKPVTAPCALIAGGETTVRLNGHLGFGGPNQEFAVGAAIELDGQRDIVALSMDTDGTDGPTPFAGGLVDGSTATTAREEGIDLNAALNEHNGTHALNGVRSLIESGATGTNVNDLVLILIDSGQ